MTDHYEPSSYFLKALMAGDLPLCGSAFGDINLEHLISLTQDQDRSNRDWACFLLAQSEVNGSSVRDALIRAASDEDQFVRAEALAGLVSRDPEFALPLVWQALRAEEVAAPIFEAAEKLAHPSLVDPLRRWTHSSGARHMDALVLDALAACEAAAAPPHDGFTA